MNGLETRGKTRIVLWALLAAALILYGFPFVYLLLTSFKTPLEAISVPPSVLPTQWTLENYVSALSREGVPAALVNSVITAVISTPSRGSALRADASSSWRRS
jgi:multiple sugar transport system permease protein